MMSKSATVAATEQIGTEPLVSITESMTLLASTDHMRITVGCASAIKRR